jgi:hypothetical protein
MFAHDRSRHRIPLVMQDAFFSEEDLDLRHLSFTELNRVWNAWLRQAQVTNDRDVHDYSHGVFTREPVAPAATSGPGEHDRLGLGDRCPRR